MADKPLKSYDIGKDVYLFKYNMDSNIIVTLLTLIIGFPILLLLAIFQSSPEETRENYYVTQYDPDYDPLNPPYTK